MVSNNPSEQRHTAYQSGLNRAYIAFLAAILDDMPAEQKQRVKRMARSIGHGESQGLNRQSSNFAAFQQGLEFGLDEIDRLSSGL